MKLTLANGLEGRLQFCMNKISEYIGTDDNLYLVVPDQSSYLSEQTAVNYFGGTGLNGVEVLTFNRMTYRFIKPNGKADIYPAGKNMLLYKALKNTADKSGEDKKPNLFAASMRKPGFVNSMASVLAEFKRYGITPYDLISKGASSEEKTAADKSASLYEIYSEYERLLGEKFNDSDDALFRLAEDMRESDLSKTRFWISGFTDFMPGHYRVIETLIEKAAEVTIVLPVPDGNIIEESIYYDAYKTYLNIVELAANIRCDFFRMSVNTAESERKPALEFFNRCWDSRDNHIFEDECPEIELITASDPYEEIDAAAQKITELVMYEDYRYSDIAVLAGDFDNTVDTLEGVFGDYAIPYFADYKIPLSSHPAVLPVLAMFDVIKSNYSFDSVFRYLKSGFIYIKDEENSARHISDTDIFKLENYVLKKGYRGAAIWTGDRHWDINDENIFDCGNEYSYNTAEDNVGSDFYDNLRRAATAPIENFKKRTKGGKTITQMAEALYLFLCDINMYDGIVTDIRELENTGRQNEAARLRQIWELILGILDQAVVSDSGDNISREEFREYISTGFSAVEIRIIPPGLDRVTVTSCDRGISADIKAVLVLGANFGSVPPSAPSEGILSDRDRFFLAKSGLNIAPDTMALAEQIKNKTVKSMMRAKEYLYISRAAANAQGAETEQSLLIGELKEMFPALSEKAASTEYLPISTPDATIHKLLMRHDRRNKLWYETADWYRNNGYDEYLSIIDTAVDVSGRQAQIKDLTKYRKIYPDTPRYSISGLELFGKCPFRYFLSRGIRAKEREEWKIAGSDYGSLTHSVIERFCRTVDGGSKTAAERKSNWEKLTDTESIKILNEIIDDITKNTLEKAARSGKQIYYILEKLRKILKRTVFFIRKAIVSGSYVPAAYEYQYNIKLGDIFVRGRIDRIDMYEHDNDADFIIIDYKSGAGEKKYNVLDIYNRLSLQLAVYALAAEYSYLHDEDFPLKEQESEETHTRGIFYNKIITGYTKSTDENALSSEEDASQMRYSGVVFADKPDKNFDKAVIDAMDSGIDEITVSEIIPIKLKKDKNISLIGSSIEEEENIEMLKSWVSRVIEDADEQINSGNICMYPSIDGSGEAACEQYCEFKDACLFKRGIIQPRKFEKSKEAAWDDIKKEHHRRKGEV